MIEPYIGDPGDEQPDTVHPMNLTWYKDKEGYFWPTPAEGRVLDVTEE